MRPSEVHHFASLSPWNGVWERGCDEAEISEESAFSLNEGKAFSE